MKYVPVISVHLRRRATLKKLSELLQTELLETLKWKEFSTGTVHFRTSCSEKLTIGESNTDLSVTNLLPYSTLHFLISVFMTPQKRS